MLSSDISRRALTWEIYGFAQGGWQIHKGRKWVEMTPCRSAVSFVHFVLESFHVMEFPYRVITADLHAGAAITAGLSVTTGSMPAVLRCRPV